MTDTANKPTNYSPAQEAIIRAASDAALAQGAKLDLAAATEIASNPAMNTSDGTARKPRSIVAKINRMGLPYQGKVAVSKTGEPVTKKTDLVSRIAAIVSGNMEGLDKAPKAALVAIANFVEAAETTVTVELDEASEG